MPKTVKCYALSKVIRLRLFLPGFEGNMSVKWLRRLKLGNAPWQSREETSAYTDLMPDGTALQFTFHMEVKSVITTPSGGQTLKQTGFHEIQGLAWSGRGKIRKVEVSVDAGKQWQEAGTARAHSKQSLGSISPAVAMDWAARVVTKPSHR
jgi:DMSO/TMAO reductase YedYZ molybdopterin-dependent catalytic subunit